MRDAPTPIIQFRKHTMTLLTWQAIIACGLSLLAGWWSNSQTALVVLLGSGTAYLGNAYYAFRVLQTRQLPPQQLFARFCRTEVERLVLAALLLGLSLHYLNGHFLALLLGYGLTHLTIWPLLLIVTRPKRRAIHRQTFMPHSQQQPNSDCITAQVSHS